MRFPQLAAALAGGLPMAASACSGCAPLVRAYLFERGDFLLNLVLVLTPLVALALVASLLHGTEPRREGPP